MLILTAFLFSGCYTPIAEDKTDYIGTWTYTELPENMFGGKQVQIILEINKEGNGSYEEITQEGAVKLSSSASNLQTTISEGKISIEFYGLGKTFTIDKAPYVENGYWYMIIDGKKMQKQ